MDEKRAKIIEIIKRNNNTLFPTKAPEEIADEIIEIIKDGEFSSPSKNDCVNYILEKELMDNKSVAQINETAELFINYYASVGWVVGKAKKPMKSWKKALNNWCKRDWTKKSSAKSKVEESIKAYMLLQNQKSDRNG